MKKLAFCLLMLSSSFASAAGAFNAKVTLVEVSYMPGLLKFILDNGDASCPAGTWITWGKSDDNNKAVYSSLLSAMYAERKIRFHYDTPCVGTYIHMLDDK